MKLLLLVFLFIYMTVSAVDKVNWDKYQNYFSDRIPVKYYNRFPITRFINDTLHVKFMLYENGEVVEIERLNMITKEVHGLRYYKKSRKIKEKYSKSPDGIYRGDMNVYDEKGDLIYTWNQELNEFKCKNSMFFSQRFFEKIKNVADSIVISNYGKDFFDKYIFWNYNESAKYCSGDFFSWCDEKKGDFFYVSYDVLFEKNIIFGGKINILFDSLGRHAYDLGNYYFSGNVVKNSAVRKYGISKDSVDNFIKLHAKDFEKVKYIEYNLDWNNTENAFSLEVRVLYPQKYSKGMIVDFGIETFFFNPWTGEFIEKTYK